MLHHSRADDTGQLNDEEGCELPDFQAARQMALRGARSLICASVMDGQLDLSGTMCVTDGSGNVLYEVTYREAVGVPVLERLVTPLSFPWRRRR
ncbi:DUF6894 family protein [Aurantiacibacter poecillastricola]|uniref:DUF6894 family protein n=1 Tax=Aurantiacibacter poecillastricola TaxID=3064385 RepID=UPI003530F9D4